MATKAKLINELKLAFDGATSTSATITMGSIVTITTAAGSVTGKCISLQDNSVMLDTSVQYNTQQERIDAADITDVTIVTPTPDPFA